jgi:regulator of cell morphogenesis and NO signaling
MEAEHDAAGEALRHFSALTTAYQPPADACGSLLALLDGLAALERDLHLHIHKENNLLFRRTRALLGSGQAAPSPRS